MDSKTLDMNWLAVCDRIKTYPDVDQSQVSAFFSRLQPQAMSEGFLMLTADNDFIKNWVETHYLDTIIRGLQDIYQIPFTVVIEVDTTSSNPSISSNRSNGSSSLSFDQDRKNIPADISSHPGPNDNIDLSLSSNEKTGLLDRSAHTTSFSSSPSTANMSTSDMNIASPDTALPVSSPIDDDNVGYTNGSLSQRIDGMNDARPFIPTSFPIGQDTYFQPTEERKPLDDSPTSSLTFENFVIGDSNRMAYSMAVDVAEMPGRTPLNPLFIYGKSGLGKTHLMRAIQNYVRETQPHLRTVYVDSAELLSDYMDAAAANDKEKTSYKNFKTYYEEADVLLIDDIQYLQGKKQTLDIVFQIFNKLMDQGRQIVFSADRAPKNIDVDERYHSRFNNGGTIDIQPPEIETKLSIVKSFLNQYKSSEGLNGMTIPDDTLLYIAENSSSNIRELKSAITKIVYQIKFFDKNNITIEDVHDLLKDHFSGGNSKNLTVEDIQGVVENFFKVSHKDLVGPKRARNIVYPRQIAIYLCRQMLDLPFNDIGKKFSRDHSTAMHSVTSVEELMRTNREVQEEIEVLKQLIREL